MPEFCAMAEAKWCEKHDLAYNADKGCARCNTERRIQERRDDLIERIWPSPNYCVHCGELSCRCGRGG